MTPANRRAVLITAAIATGLVAAAPGAAATESAAIAPPSSGIL